MSCLLCDNGLFILYVSPSGLNKTVLHFKGKMSKSYIIGVDKTLSSERPGSILCGKTYIIFTPDVWRVFETALKKRGLNRAACAWLARFRTGFLMNPRAVLTERLSRKSKYRLWLLISIKNLESWLARPLFWHPSGPPGVQFHAPGH